MSKYRFRDGSIETLRTGRITRPNFFLLGAGRCGTSTLHKVLSQHPQVFMPTLKEPSFFCSYFQVVKDPVTYYRLFDPGEGRAAVGEASHVYLSNPETASLLHALFPEARFVLIFRNPVERAYSLYQWARHAKVEPLDTFEEALRAEPERYGSVDFFKNCPQYFWNFMYVRSSYYDVQWSRYLQHYGRDRFFALSLGELTREPRLWMQRLYAFLGVDPGFEPTVEHLNSRVYAPMAADTRARLTEHFEPTVARTHALAGRNLGLDEDQ